MRRPSHGGTPRLRRNARHTPVRSTSSGQSRGPAWKSGLFAAIGIGFVLGTPGCSDEGPLLFPPPSQALPLLEGTPGAEVGTTVQLGPLFVLQDRSGNPVVDLRIPAEVTVGGGTLAGEFAYSDLQGRVVLPDFTLDTIAGPNRVTLRIPGMPARQVTVEGAPGSPARAIAEPDSALLGEAEVGSTLPSPISVRLLDRYGNPVPNRPVTFHPVEGGGSAGSGVEPGSVFHQLTDQDGRAAAEWTLGTTPGPNQLLVRLGELVPRVFIATAVPGPLDRLVTLAPAQQSARISDPVLYPPRVRAEDRFGNPLEGVEVTFTVVSGSGEVEPSMTSTDSTGTAGAVSWVLGPEEGPQLLDASAGAHSVRFEAHASPEPPGPQVRIEAVHFNQGSQTLHGDIDLVAGREGLLRVFITAPEPIDLRPDVEVELFSGGGLAGTFRIQATTDSLRTTLDPDRFESTWNALIPGSLIQPGLEVRVTIDPDEQLDDPLRLGYVYPAPGETAPITVRQMEPLEVVLVPIRQAPNGLEGRVDAGNADALLELTRRLFPLEGIDWRVRTPYVTQVELTSDFNRWAQVVNELLAVRVDEEDGDAYYYGVAQVSYQSGIAGIGFVPSGPQRPEKVSMGWDYPASAPYVAAHELGHNLGRFHSNCGGASNPDPAAPPFGEIVSPGWDIERRELRPTTGHRDIMSYCRPEWVSDYTFAGVLDWLVRLQSGPLLAAASTPSTGVMIWGRLGAGGAHLEPVFPSEGPAVLPDRPGPHRVAGYTADGRILFDVDFEGTPVDHSPDPTERHFAFRVPLSLADQERLHRVEISGPGALEVRETPRTPEGVGLFTRPPTGLREDPRRLRVEWDAAAHPLAVIRDESGAIVSLARGGSAELVTEETRFEVLLSDGVRSRRFDIEVPR